MRTSKNIYTRNDSPYCAAFNKLDWWLNRNGWSGYDPYDIKGTRVFIKLKNLNKALIFTAEVFSERFPKLFRRIFGIKRRINAKAMGLFARGYLKYYSHFKNLYHLNKALYCLSWLLKNPSPGYSGLCWGYPFDWQSKIFIPQSTPSGVVSATVAHAFLDAFETLEDTRYLDIVKSICDFFLNDLNIDYVSSNELCFSYTPLDNFHVHNVNMLVASVFARAGFHLGNQKFLDIAEKAVNYTVRRQNSDGSWYYWDYPSIIDNYHTGFVLESLNIYRRYTKDFSYDSSLENGLKYYAKNLFLSDGTPKFASRRTYPIDIHSCAQGIITFSEVVDFSNAYLEVLNKIVQWTLKNMQDHRGFFYYRIYNGYYDRVKIPFYRKYINKIPYIRWAQAWMLRALSYLCIP